MEKVYKTNDGSFLVLSKQSYSVIDGEKLEAVVSETVGLKTSVWREKIAPERLEELEREYIEQKEQRDKDTIELIKQAKQINIWFEESKKHWRDKEEEKYTIASNGEYLFVDKVTYDTFSQFGYFKYEKECKKALELFEIELYNWLNYEER